MQSAFTTAQHNPCEPSFSLCNGNSQHCIQGGLYSIRRWTWSTVFCASCLPLNAACLFARCLISDCIVWLIPTSFLGAFAQYTQRAHSTKALPYPTLMRSIAIPPKLYPSQLSFITFLCRQSCVPSAVQPTPPEAVNRLRGFLRIPNVSLGYFDSAPQI